MSSMQENIVLVYCSSKIISRLESVISSEWNKKENLELLLKSIEAFESFVVCLRNGKPLTHTGSLGKNIVNEGDI